MTEKESPEHPDRVPELPDTPVGPPDEAPPEETPIQPSSEPEDEEPPPPGVPVGPGKTP